MLSYKLTFLASYKVYWIKKKIFNRLIFIRFFRFKSNRIVIVSRQFKTFGDTPFCKGAGY